MKIQIINGPNLNLLGKREPEIYGDEDFTTYFEALKKGFQKVSLDLFQSNVEGELIDKLQEVGFSYDGIIINPGGYTHTSVAIGDTIAAISTPVVEVHISDPKKREPYRHVSMVEDKCIGTIAGLGLDSYKFAIQFLVEREV